MNHRKPVIDLTDVYKIYRMGGTEVEASAGINLKVYAGEFIVIMGPSGSGKSTVMNIIGCLDRPTRGSYLLDGKEVSKLGDDDLAYVRNQKLGFVFQKFHLLAGSSAGENVQLPMIYAGVKTADRLNIARKSLTKVGLADRINHMPNELSGGQMQRVAIARALVNKPPILLADEPTGNLDSRSGDEIMALFQELHRQGTTIVLITHNPEVAKYGTRVVKLHDGRIMSDEKVEESDRIILSHISLQRTTTGLLNMRGRMNFFQSFKVAWNALKSNKMRSLLTMLGIIIGVAAVIVMTSIGEGTRYNVLEQIYSMGSNLVFVTPGSGENVIGSSIGSEARLLTMADVDTIKNKCLLIRGVSPEISRSVTIRYLSNNLTSNLVGTTPDFFHVRNFPVENGRAFTEKEIKSRAPVCVIGSYVAKKLFKEGESPLGKTVKISMGSSDPQNDTRAGVRLTVIGVLEKKGKTFGEDNDKKIIVPLDTVKYRIFNEKHISVIYLEAVSSDKMDDAIKEVKWAILPLHGNNPKNIDISSQEEILKQVEATMGAFTFMLGGIAFISLLVGGIGIMNIMLVSVTERTREIGLRKAIGAKRRDILVQFLIESLVLGITGGIIGIGIGMLMAGCYTLIASYSNLGVMSRTIVSLQAILISFTFSAMIGVFFGIYPARKAASLDPIEALRYE